MASAASSAPARSSAPCTSRTTTSRRRAARRWRIMGGVDVDDPSLPAPGAGDEPTETPVPKAKRGLPRLARGAPVGRYIVLDVLGAGGMGVVYRAYDPELDRRIALKLVRDQRGNSSRLLEEAQALAKVTHPNVVAVHDVGTHAGAVFIAMELAPGKTILAWRNQDAPTRRQVLDVFLAAGNGLAAAHKAGIVHRDFKPSNVIVGDDGRTRVVDFGLARAAEPTLTPTPGSRPRSEATPTTGDGRARSRIVTSGATHDLDHERDPGRDDANLAAEAAVAEAAAPVSIKRPGEITLDTVIGAPEVMPSPPTATPGTAVEGVIGGGRAGRTPLERAEAADAADATELELDTPSNLPRVVASRAMGTPSYMAPEQRKAGIYDARVDQYAFAVALYEALYNERPFAGATDAELNLNEVADRVRPAPRGADVPSHLRRALLRALRAAPDERFPSMEALLAAIADDPVARWRKRAAIGVGALALVGLVVVLTRRSEAVDPCATARAPLVGVWDDDLAAATERALIATNRPYAPTIAQRVTTALTTRADRWGALRESTCIAHRDGEYSDELFDRAVACLDHRKDELRALTAQLARGPDPALLDHALAAVAALSSEADCADRERLLAAVPPPTDPDVRAKVAALRTELAQIDAQGWTAEYAHARDRAALLVVDATALGYAPILAEATSTAGEAYHRAGELARAETTLYDAARNASVAKDDVLAAETWISLVGIVGYELARTDDGLTLARAAEAAVARVGGHDDLVAKLLHARALATSTRDTGAAIPLEEQALAIREKTGDADLIAESVNDLARLHANRGDYAEAEVLHRRALTLREQLLGAQHPLVAESLNNLGVVIYHQGRLDEARPLYERALAMRIAVLGPDHYDVGVTLNNLGGLYLDTGDDAKAADYLGRALANWEHALGPDHPDLAIPLANLGDLANRQGDHATALADCERALRIEEKAAGPDDPDLAYNLACIAEAHLGAKRASAALPPLERALRLREASPGDLGELARTRLDLVLALTAARGDALTGSELVRARGLADQACQVLDTLGATWRVRAAACNAWRIRHR
ncbi:MAG: serine/threonine-protein kinase [Deltaproteobacteria bacterium]|nr:serine/threonine-protein kinase [Deltaproteobacteria bacterium]